MEVEQARKCRAGVLQDTGSLRAHRVIEDRLSKDEGIQVGVGVQLLKDSQNGDLQGAAQVRACPGCSYTLNLPVPTHCRVKYTRRHSQQGQH